MELVPAEMPLCFDVTFDSPSLFVAMTVYDYSGPSPVLAMAPTAMTLIYGNTYSGKFTPAFGKNYVIIKGVYTDGSFTTLNPNYYQGSESIVAAFSTAQNIQAIVGVVPENETISGSVLC